MSSPGSVILDRSTFTVRLLLLVILFNSPRGPDKCTDTVLVDRLVIIRLSSFRMDSPSITTGTL